MDHDSGQEESAFRFNGRWQDFGRIVVPNILLTIVTLGIYRFWATTRERQYLWSHSEFIDAPLEWTGRGIELFIGFILAIVVFLIPYFGASLLAQILIARGHPVLGGLLVFGVLFLIMYLLGVARFRALRYRLSRTYWHGIRGGSNDQGFAYGWSYIWKTICGYLALGLLVPWSMMDLWNERWNHMSFGPHRVHATGLFGDTFLRYLLFYLSPIVFFVGGIAVAAMTAAGNGSPASVAVSAILMVLIFYGALGLIALAFYAKFFRVAVGGLSLERLDFAFTARTKDWFILFLGDVGLWLLAALPVGLIATALGLFSNLQNLDPLNDPSGYQRAIFIIMFALAILPFTLIGPFIRYRHWKFFITYMQAYGEIDLDSLTQSTTPTPRQGEGLLDAFDVGAI